MESHYAKFMKESLNREVIEDESGFITFYKLTELPDVCYIADIYLDPDFRKIGNTARLEKLAIDWALANGCKKVLGSVNMKMSTPEKSMVELIKAGYKLSHVSGELIFFMKEISYG